MNKTIIKKLNKIGINNIIIVDNLRNGYKCINLSNLDFYDYIDKDDFINLILLQIKLSGLRASEPKLSLLLFSVLGNNEIIGIL